MSGRKYLQVMYLIRVNIQKYEELTNSIVKKKKKTNLKNPIKIQTEDLNRYFPKEDIQISKRYMRRYSASLIDTEMQTKTAMRYHLTPVRMAMIKKTRDNKVW